MKKQLSVHLRIYRGKTLGYDAKGKSTNENHIVTLMYDTPEWHQYLKHMRSNGIIKVDVEQVLDLAKVNEGKAKSDPDYYKSVDDFEDVSSEVKKAFDPEVTKPLTPDQQRIKELEDKVESLLGSKTEQTPVDEELKKARQDYESVTGKKGGPKWTVEEINTKIEEFKANQGE